jgi:hypothetical protein
MRKALALDVSPLALGIGFKKEKGVDVQSCQLQKQGVARESLL